MTTLEPKRTYKRLLDLASVWDEYRRTKSQSTRNKLIEQYRHLVVYQAERVHSNLPTEVQVEDLISVGTFGLIDAIGGFDPSRGIKFETYSARRIRGAILDELRAMDWVPRLVRSRSAKMGGATKSLEAELGRQPTSQEIAKRLNITMGEFDMVKADSDAVGVVSLSRKWFETDSNKDVSEIDVLEDRTAQKPNENVLRRDFFDSAMRGFNRAERLVIVLYYLEEMTMREIGDTLGISESRVSQMHSGLLRHLKSTIIESDWSDRRQMA